MPYIDFILEETADGNIEHIAQHGLTPEEVEEVVLDPAVHIYKPLLGAAHCVRLQQHGEIYCRGVRTHRCTYGLSDYRL